MTLRLVQTKDGKFINFDKLDVIDFKLNALDRLLNRNVLLAVRPGFVIQYVKAILDGNYNHIYLRS